MFKKQLTKKFKSVSKSPIANKQLNTRPMFHIMLIVFILGIIGIALEEKMRINKTAIALLMCIMLWLMLMFGAHTILVERENPGFAAFVKSEHIATLSIQEQITNYLTEESFVPHLGDVAQILFFVMCALLIVHIVDKHGGFVAIARFIRTEKKRRLLWYIGFSTFFFSALFNNLAAAIILIAILRKLVPNKTDRIKYACVIILAANAGGSWSPIGDIATLLLWTEGNITPLHQISRLFLPALANLLVMLTITHFWLFKKNDVLRQKSELTRDDLYIEHIPHKSRITIFWIGISSLALVPVFQSLTHLPAFLCVLLGLVFLWIYTDLMYGKINDIRDSSKLRIDKLSHAVDLPTILFFLGILMSVAALNVGGQLAMFADFLSKHIGHPYLINIVIGGVAPIMDNVALVAASIAMFPVQEASADLTPYLHYFTVDGGFWTLLAYCAVAGGNILIFGSATGVAIMGMEKISFGYFLKRFTPLAIVGYFVGIGVFLLMN
jgi:Na+/H+ antiporter NhaD/arsenite permease-like protein